MNRGQYFTPTVTAFNEDGSLDIESNRRLWDNLIKSGMSGIVVLGSTGEFFAMTPKQKTALIDEATAYLKRRIKLFIGTGSMLLNDTVEFSKYALKKGADGVMIVGPFYSDLTDESAELFFGEAAKQIRGNIFIYNFPSRTGYDMNPAITLRLARAHKNIIGYKDTVSGISHTQQLITTMRAGGCDDFLIMAGSDPNFVQVILSGGNGSIGGFSNLYPELCGAWIKAVDAKDMQTIAAIQMIMNRITDIGRINGPAFIPILKRAMMLRGLPLKTDACQFPFLPATDGQHKQIKALLDQVDPMIKSIS